MKESQIFNRKLLCLLCMWIQFPRFSSESISLCHNKSDDINCKSDYQIVLKDARLGHLSRLDSLNRNNTKWCQKSDSYFKLKPVDCVTSLRQVISNRCTGTKSCHLGMLTSNYLVPAKVACDMYDHGLNPMSLYIDFDCVPKELFYTPDLMGSIFHVGGYMTSLGYTEQKTNDVELFNDLARLYRKNGLPIKTILRPKLNRGHYISEPFIFQLQIIENSISLNTNATSNTCQQGELFSQDYYAFMPINNTQELDETRQLSICPTKAAMVGQIFGPIIANGVNIMVNVNFTSITKRVLLVKFTTILCPAIVLENADTTYDHVVNSNKSLSVTGVASIACKHGFFLLSMSTLMRNVTSRTISCDHDTGSWNQSLTLEKCVNKLPIPSSKLTTIHSITSERPYDVTSSTNLSTFHIVSTKTSTTSSFTKHGLPILIVLLVTFALLLFLLWKYRDKIKCIENLYNWYSKLRYKNDAIPRTDFSNYPRASIRNSYGHTFIFDDNTPMTESFMTNTLSPNGSCRQSNRTLITRAGSRPTIISGDSMQTSNYIFESDPNQYGDELPTKSPKSSHFTRMMRSASNLRNSSLGRPKSLSRQSFTDRGSSIFDTRFSGSQIPLLMSRRSNLPPEFLESNSAMCTSDISPSISLTKSAVLLRKKPNNRPYSQSDLSFQSKMNGKVISPTIDTYLEPTESSILPYGITEDSNTSHNSGHKNSDYVVYDHSRLSSNNLDTTCQSSVIASLSDDNANDEDEIKRFSMISNPYYGMQGAEPRHNNPTFSNNLDSIRNRTNSNSNESVYESIDGDHLHQSTIDRRNMALPTPPTYD